MIQPLERNFRQAAALRNSSESQKIPFSYLLGHCAVRAVGLGKDYDLVLGDGALDEFGHWSTHVGWR